MKKNGFLCTFWSNFLILGEKFCKISPKNFSHENKLHFNVNSNVLQNCNLSSFMLGKNKWRKSFKTKFMKICCICRKIKKLAWEKLAKKKQIVTDGFQIKNLLGEKFLNPKKSGTIFWTEIRKTMLPLL